MEFLVTFCSEINQWKERTDSLISTLDSIKAGVKNMSTPLNTKGIAYKTVLARYQHDFPRRDIGGTYR